MIEQYAGTDNGTFCGLYAPDDLRHWLCTHDSDADIALAMQRSSLQLRELLHEADETSEPWADDAFEKWREIKDGLKDGLKEIILDRLSGERDAKDTEYLLSKKGTHYPVQLLLIKNGD